MRRNFFNHIFGIRNVDTEHLDVPLDSDLEAFICPYLVVNGRNHPVIEKVYQKSTAFFSKLNGEFVVLNDRVGGLEFLSHLKEPNRYHLGYSFRNKGKGVGEIKAETIFDALIENDFVRQGVTVTNEAQNVLLLVKGIGQDNISDILSNICRDIFAEFTEEQCVKHGIPVYDVEIEYYNLSNEAWETKKVKLPEYGGKNIVLVPKKIVSGSRAYSSYYNWFVAKNYLSYELMNKSKLHSSRLGKYFRKLSNGTKKAIVKVIFKDYRKPKEELIDFVVKYQGSLLEFQDYAKDNYPELDLSSLGLYKS